MGRNDHVDHELSSRIDALIEVGYLDSVSPSALGIAKQVSDGGTGTMSDKQRCIYEKEIEPILLSAPPTEDLIEGGPSSLDWLWRRRP